MKRLSISILLGLGLFAAHVPAAKAATTVRCKKSGHTERDRYLMRSHSAFLAAEARKSRAAEPARLQLHNAAVAERETARIELMKLVDRVNEGRRVNTREAVQQAGERWTQNRNEATARELDAATRRLNEIRTQLMTGKLTPTQARTEATSVADDVERAIGRVHAESSGGRSATQSHGIRGGQLRMMRFY